MRATTKVHTARHRSTYVCHRAAHSGVGHSNSQSKVPGVVVVVVVVVVIVVVVADVVVVVVVVDVVVVLVVVVVVYLHPARRSTERAHAIRGTATRVLQR